jgi:hypothetical protein
MQAGIIKDFFSEPEFKDDIVIEVNLSSVVRATHMALKLMYVRAHTRVC